MGAFVLYILNRHNGKKPFSFFSAMNIDVSDKARPKTIFLDMTLSSLIGAIVVMPLVCPTTIGQAVVAGLGMTGILSVNSTDISAPLPAQASPTPAEDAAA